MQAQATKDKPHSCVWYRDQSHFWSTCSELQLYHCPMLNQLCVLLLMQSHYEPLPLLVILILLFSIDTSGPVCSLPSNISPYTPIFTSMCKRLFGVNHLSTKNVNPTHTCTRVFQVAQQYISHVKKPRGRGVYKKK